MTPEELTRIDRILAEVGAIIQESIERKMTQQDVDLLKSYLRLRTKVQKRKSALKRSEKP